MRRNNLLRLLFVLAFALVSLTSAFAIGEDEGATDFPQATVVNDEGGPVVVTGEVTYTNPFFTVGVSQPLIILEDQAGFVDRNEYFLFPPESQVLGQITSNFLESPFTYSLSLPVEPQGTLRDVDNDGADDTGVMVFAVAYWSNTFGDPFLEERDMSGGGWSGAYASTRISTDPNTRLEVVGGKYLIYAPEEGQGFPSGFGPDGLLFTVDDPIVIVPQGYSVVDLDSEPFTFDRARNQSIDLIEPETAALDDFSSLPFTEAWDEMIEKFKTDYAFTDYHGLDWDALSAEYRPRVQSAETMGDDRAFALALRDFLWEIPDGHVSMSLGLIADLFQTQTGGGVGIAIRELSDGRVIANFLLEGAPAAEAGIQLGAEIIEWNGQPIADAISETFIWAHQALGTEHTERLQQLRYVTRAPLGEQITITYQNPGDDAPQTVTLDTVAENTSFNFSSFNAGISGNELPVEFEILPSGYGYVSIYSFSDDEYLTVQLWERMIRTFKDAGVPGIIIDMRNNGGGSGFLADQMAAYFFDEVLELGQSGFYNEDLGDFYFDPRGVDRFYLPPEEDRYLGPTAVIVAPSCFSACEFFSYAMTLQDRADIVGHYPTGGLGGSIEQFRMPAGIGVVMTIGRAVDPNGEIHIEGKGVAPTVTVPVTEEAVIGDDDVLLAAAEEALTRQIRGDIIAGGALQFGDTLGSVSASAQISPEQSVQYEVLLPGNTVVSFYAEGATGDLDTVLRIYDPTGSQVLAENDDAESGGVGSALEDLSVGPDDLTVVVEVTVKDDATPGSTFNLRIEAAPTPDDQ